MRIEIDISSLKRTRWSEYLTRFLVGGAVTVVAGLVAKKFGAGIGGLFLAFPAIFPSTATLIASHEREKKALANMNGQQRGRKAAGADAAGAAMGAVGLTAFAAVTCWGITIHPVPMTLAAALLVWLAVSFVIWQARETVWRRIRARFFRQPNTKTILPHHRSSNEQERHG
jgi:hypothetical protein